MLDASGENLHRKLWEMKSAPMTPVEVIEGIKQFSEDRRLAQKVIALDFALDDFVGIVMMDKFDEAYIDVIDSLVIHYTAGDPTPPTPEAINVFAERLGNMPPLGNTPASFIIAIVIVRAWNAAYTIPADDPGKNDVSEVAIRAIGQATSSYKLTRTGDIRQKSDDFWHFSVIERLRCPDHRSPYKLLESRNGLRPDGALFRRYIIECEECRKQGLEHRKLDFDLGVLSDMTRSGGIQKLEGRIASPADRRPTVDP
jgi:hypothetical protein